MSRIPVQSLDIHAEMAHAPVALAAYAAITDALAKQSRFDTRTREAIALAVGAQNGCDYRQAAHTPAAIKSGLSEAETIVIRRDDPAFDPGLAVLLALVREAASNVRDVSDLTWKTAQQAGWTDVELSEAFARLAANLFTNFFNHYARTDLDVPAAPALAP